MLRILLMLIFYWSAIAQALEPTEEQLRATTQYYLEAAKAGDPNAQLMVSQAYWNGWGVPKHEEISLRWLNKAVAQNYPAAIFDLGYRTLNGTGITKNIEGGISLLDKASTMGSTDAMVVLGSYYLNLSFDHKIIDARKGKEYLRKAAENGDSNGMLQLGLMYMYGLEPGADLDSEIQKEKVIHWLTKSAELLNLNAMMAISAFYSDPSNRNLDADRTYFWLSVVRQLTGNVPPGLAGSELKLSVATRSKVQNEVSAWLKKYNNQRQSTL